MHYGWSQNLSFLNFFWDVMKTYPYSNWKIDFYIIRNIRKFFKEMFLDQIFVFIRNVIRWKKRFILIIYNVLKCVCSLIHIFVLKFLLPKNRFNVVIEIFIKIFYLIYIKSPLGISSSLFSKLFRTLGGVFWWFSFFHFLASIFHFLTILLSAIPLC